MWQERLKTPIYYGYSSDETINNINKESWKLNKYRYKDSVIYKINDIAYRYNELLDELQDNDINYISITL